MCVKQSKDSSTKDLCTIIERDNVKLLHMFPLEFLSVSDLSAKQQENGWNFTKYTSI